MIIDVEPFGWGTASPEDIGVLLADVASHLHRLLVEPVVEQIRVVPASGPDAVPITLFRHAQSGPITIQLAARDTYWAQFSYQFAHEFCHVLSDYERLRDNPNRWFHEALCELASVFTLRRMAERWPTQPPYPHWTEYAGNLASYAEDLLTNDSRTLPEGVHLATWLSNEECELRKNAELRGKNAIVAYQLLPPIRRGSQRLECRAPYAQFYRDLDGDLADWHECVQPADKPFVKRVIGAFQ